MPLGGPAVGKSSNKMFWRVSTYSQQTPADAILDKGHVILEDLLEVEDLAKVPSHILRAAYL